MDYTGKDDGRPQEHFNFTATIQFHRDWLKRAGVDPDGDLTTREVAHKMTEGLALALKPDIAAHLINELGVKPRKKPNKRWNKI